MFAQLAFIYCMNIHLFAVTSALFFWWGVSALGGVGFVLFSPGGNKLPQKIFKHVFLKFRNAWGKWAVNVLSVNHWSISMSAVTDLPEMTWCPRHAIKVIFVSLTENTANHKISITFWEVLRLKMSITSLKSQAWVLYLEFFSNASYCLGAE